MFKIQTNLTEPDVQLKLSLVKKKGYNQYNMMVHNNNS